MNESNVDAFSELMPAYVARTLDVANVAAVREHLETCARCRSDMNEWETVRSGVHRAAADTPMPTRGVVERALAKIDGQAERMSWQERWIPRALRRPRYERSLAAVATVVVVALAVMLTPIGSYAEDLFQTLQPKQFVVVPVTLADLQSLPSLAQYGTFAEGAKGAPPQVSADAASASTAAGMTVLTPSSLPASVTAAPTYVVVPSYSGTFTFSAAKAAQAASAQGKTLPPMPSNIDGSTVQLTTGAGVIAVYGGGAAAFETHEGPATATPAVTASAGSIAGARAIPQLIVAQAFAPVATATGAPVKDLEQYLLSQPGITDNLANAIRAIGDPTSVWPILVPLGKVNTHSTTVLGSAATVFSDVSGFAAGVVWVKDGIIHIVGGPFSESDVLKIAASLH